MERRLSTILAADMVGYSRLMEADETGTLTRQTDYRQSLIDPAIAAHRGRIVKTTGDGLLVEFASVVSAVQCAVDFQAAMSDRESDQPEDRRIAYRIGINLGDILEEDGDLFGDAVNIAARLEAMAEPGGICLSGTAYDHLKAKVDVGYEALGEVQVKNIETPVRVYRVVPGEAVAGATRTARRGLPLARIAASIALLALAIGGYLWWQTRPDFTPADPEKYAFELPEKPSIVVLPFDNLTGDPANDYLGDGLTESLISGLGQHPKMFVIARNSSFTYKGKPTKVQKIAEELGVRYVLEGSVQISGGRLRVAAQLIDALGGHHLWAERFDYDLSTEGLFAVQDEILGKVLLALDVRLVSGHIAVTEFEDAGDLETYILIRSAIAAFQKFTPQSNEKARELSQMALDRNPNSAMALMHMAWTNWFRVVAGSSEDAQRELAEARMYATMALNARPENGWGSGVLAWIDLYERNYDSAIKNAENALRGSPGGGIVASLAGWVYASSGYPERGVQLLTFGMRTEPFYPNWVPLNLAMTYMMQGKFEEAKAVLRPLYEESRQPMYANPLIVTLVHLEDVEMARQTAENVLRQHPHSSVEGFFRAFGYIRDQDFQKMYADALRAAGLPEHPPSSSIPD